jgi:sialate O-acetylesterase
MAWYQGESDVGIPGYANRLRELIAGWRQQFNPNLRMLVVQLPNWGPTTEKPAASGWAEIRNEEFKAVAADRNAALIPTLDIGENDNLHPLDKLRVGLRMAMAAEGKPLPLPVSAKRQGGSVVVSFSGIEGGLHTWSSGHAIGVELCGATQESCRYAPATALNSSLRISAQPEAVGFSVVGPQLGSWITSIRKFGLNCPRQPANNSRRRSA